VRNHPRKTGGRGEVWVTQHSDTSEAMSDPPSSTNMLLELLTPSERDDVLEAATTAPLPKGVKVMERGHKIETILVPTDGVVSYATALEDGSAVETCMVGYEGIVGGELALANHAFAPVEAVVQLPGHAWVIPFDRFVELRERLPGLDELVRKQTQRMLAEAYQGIACNRLHPLEQRLSRWLLMCHDRSAGDDLELTQEFIAIMLGVQRPTVTVAVGTLQHAGLVEARRGRIAILDRDGLERSTCECYEAVQGAFLRLFGVEPRRAAVRSSLGVLDG
jgi:CRP-like cAMP-binding protein